MICLGRRSNHMDNKYEKEYRDKTMVPLNAFPLFANAELNNYFRIDSCTVLANSFLLYWI